MSCVVCVGGGGICAARKLSASELTLPRLSDADTAWRAVVAFAAASPESDHTPTPIRPCFPDIQTDGIVVLGMCRCVCMAVVHDGLVTGLCAVEDEEVSLLEAYQRAVAVYPPLGATLATKGVMDAATAAARPGANCHSSTE